MSTVPTTKAQVRVHIRWMIRRDMPEVLAIEHAGFEYPWCEEEFLRVLLEEGLVVLAVPVLEHGLYLGHQQFKDELLRLGKTRVEVVGTEHRLESIG